VTVAILTGDTDLENNLLSQSGITINSINATYIEFDFQPKTPNFDFPSYLLQKNMELPNAIFRCFFFIKGCDCGGSNRNLAVIPNTNIPVSVETIRDNTYNSNCPSTNQITLVPTTLMVLDRQSILMDKQ
jgi:hypothetical protein